MRATAVRLFRLGALPALLLGATASLPAQPARLTNARVEQRAVVGGLDRAVLAAAEKATGPIWIGYSVPVLDRRSHMCCYGSMRDLDRSPCAGRCRLEEERGESRFINADGGDCLAREGGTSFTVLLRAASARVERIRAFSQDCELDAGGLPVIWLTGVEPRESVAFLERYVTAQGLHHKKSKRDGEPALSVIASHADPAADDLLETLVGREHPEELRKHAAFWLGVSRGRRGYEVLRRLAAEEPSVELRRHVSFALSQSDVPEAVPTLVRMARDDRSAEVRGQALFWLAQKAGEKATAAIEGALQDDPDTEVKRKAVFALTQLPKDEGIPHLIRIAREHKNAEVRKQAIFWLGQSKDPRAFEFIRTVLEE